MLLSLRQTSPRLIKSPPTQQRRASVAMIVRMRPSPELVFEGSEPEGWTGEVVKRDQWGLGLGLDDFFRLCEYLTHQTGSEPSVLATDMMMKRGSITLRLYPKSSLYAVPHRIHLPEANHAGPRISHSQAVDTNRRTSQHCTRRTERHGRRLESIWQRGSLCKWGDWMRGRSPRVWVNDS